MSGADGVEFVVLLFSGGMRDTRCELGTGVRTCALPIFSVALRAVLADSLDAFMPLLRDAGEADMVRKTGWLGVYETEKKWQGAQAALELQRRRGVAFPVLEAEENDRKSVV